MTTTKRNSYTASFKLKIIKEAKVKGNRAIAKIYGINEANIRAWTKKEEILIKMPTKKKQTEVE